MYPNYLNDRLHCGYSCVKDKKSVTIVNSSILAFLIFGRVLTDEPKSVDGMGLPIKVMTPITRSWEKIESPKSLSVSIKPDLISFQPITEMSLTTSGSTITLDEAVLLRGGAGFDFLGIIVFVILANWYDSFMGVDAFQVEKLPHYDIVGGVTGKYDFRNVDPSVYKSTTSLHMEKPVSMSQEDYSGLTKSEKRQLADPKGRDGCIQIDGYPQLNIRFNQVEYKTPKHGKDHDLPVDGTGKTPKTETNAIALRDSLIDMATSQDIIWYTDGQYQGGTQRGCDSVNLFDPNRNLIAVYQKQPDGSYSFLTTCKLVPAEVKHLQDSNGNFLTEKVINQQSAVSTNIHDSTNTKNDL